MTEAGTTKTRDTHQTLTWIAWVVVAILALNVSHFVGEEIGGIWYESGASFLPLFNGWWIGIIKAMPTILIAWAIGDFALLFGRCGEGEVFTQRNIKTLNSGANSMILAGLWAGIFGPTLLSWIGGNYRGFQTDLGDLALAVTMMGVVLHGLALVFKDAVAVKQENDEFV